MPVYLIEDGYAIRGIAPLDLKDRPESDKLLFWSWVVEIGLKQKDRDLAKGIGANGKPLKRITAATRKHRVSAMTPTGKGDPSAPPLEPGRQLSRTRSLLTGRAFIDHAEFWWKFDPWSGASWARVLDHQRDQGRDVYGLGPDALRRTIAQSHERWRKYLRGQPVPGMFTISIPQAPAFVAPSGGKTQAEWEAYFRAPAKVAVPGRESTDYNVLLRHIWGAPGPAKAVAIVPKPPKPKPVVTRVALPPEPPVAPPKPKPAPKPKPTPKPEPAPAVAGQLTSIDDLHRWAKSVLPNAKIRPEGIPIENWNRLSVELDRMAREYPEVAQGVEFINPTGLEADYWSKGTLAVASRGNGKFLAFSPTFFGRDWSAVEAHAIKSVATGFNAPGSDNPLSTVTHEWGHLVDGWLEFRSTPADRAKQKELRALFNTDGKYDKMKGAIVSQYATTNEREAFAETFVALRWQPKDRQMKIVREFEEILNR